MKIPFWSKLTEKLDRIYYQVAHLERRLMAFAQDTLDMLAKIDTATDAIATRLQQLQSQLASGTVSPADQKAIADKLAAEVTRLQGLGADPSNPVPIP